MLRGARATPEQIERDFAALLGDAQHAAGADDVGDVAAACREIAATPHLRRMLAMGCGLQVLASPERGARGARAALGGAKS